MGRVNSPHYSVPTQKRFERLQHAQHQSPNSYRGPPTHSRPWRGRGRGRGRGKNKRKLGEGLFNLTDITLTDQELYVLDQVLKFAPTKNMDKFETFVDLQKFGRKLNIKKHFAIKEDTNKAIPPEKYTHSGLRNKSTFNPKTSGHQFIDVFIKMV